MFNSVLILLLLFILFEIIFKIVFCLQFHPPSFFIAIFYFDKFSKLIFFFILFFNIELNFLIKPKSMI